MSIPDREEQRRAFLAAHGLSDVVRAPLPGDASTRRYERLTRPSGATLMLMDQPPAAESQPCDPLWSPDERRAQGWNALARLSAGRIEAFAAVAAHLRSLGLSAPEIVAVDAPSGFAVIEDFGDDLFARVIEGGADEALDHGCAIIEWPERLGEDPSGCLRADRLVIVIAEEGQGRVATVSGAGRWERLIDHVHP